jgi:hypothetical protein
MLTYKSLTPVNYYLIGNRFAPSCDTLFSLFSKIHTLTFPEQYLQRLLLRLQLDRRKGGCLLDVIKSKMIYLDYELPQFHTLQHEYKARPY